MNSFTNKIGGVTKMGKMHVVGYYDTESETIATIEELKKQGYTSDEISIISKPTEDPNHIVNETGLYMADGVVAPGATTGGLIGGLGLGGVLPGLGTLSGMGIPEEEVQLYNDHFNKGKTLVLVDNRRFTDLPNRPII